MKKKISTLEERNAVLIKENNFLKQESSRTANSMNQIKAEFDDQEQYIFGVTVWRNEGFPCQRKRIQIKLLKMFAQSLMFLLRITSSPYPTE